MVQKKTGRPLGLLSVFDTDFAYAYISNNGFDCEFETV